MCILQAVEALSLRANVDGVITIVPLTNFGAPTFERDGFTRGWQIEIQLRVWVLVLSRG